MSNHQDNSQRLGDFTATPRLVPLSLLAIGIGILSTFVAWALLRLIAFFTNAFYYDPLEILFVREVMRTKLVALSAGATLNDIRNTLVREPAQRGQHLYPVVDTRRRVKGVITRRQLRELTESAGEAASLGEVLRDPVAAHADEPLRVVVFRMAETGFTRLPVVDSDTGQLEGMIRCITC